MYIVRKNKGTVSILLLYGVISCNLTAAAAPLYPFCASFRYVVCSGTESSSPSTPYCYFRGGANYTQGLSGAEPFSVSLSRHLLFVYRSFSLKVLSSYYLSVSFGKPSLSLIPQVCAYTGFHSFFLWSPLVGAAFRKTINWLILAAHLNMIGWVIDIWEFRSTLFQLGGIGSCWSR